MPTAARSAARSSRSSSAAATSAKSSKSSATATKSAKAKTTVAAAPKAAPKPVTVAKPMPAPPKPAPVPSRPLPMMPTPSAATAPVVAPMPKKRSAPPQLTTPTPFEPAPPRKIAFRIGDKAVHPQHGVGEVTAIERKEISGNVIELYVLRILDNGMKVMVSKAAAHQVGLREVMSVAQADKVLDTMRARQVAVDLQPWSRRFRAYTEMIKSGSPFEVAKVLRDMYRLKFDKDLSFGERRLLDQAKSLLFKELALAKKMTEQQLLDQVAEIFST